VSSPGVRSRHVVVIGGGITGLVAAYRLAASSNGMPIDVTLLEASGLLGGKIRTVDVGGARVEGGADSFVVRKPWAVELCKELGLHAQLVIPGASGAFVWARDRLVPFPEPSAFGVPASLGVLLRCGGLSRAGRLRAALDLWKRPRRDDRDESLGSMVSRRLGREAMRTLVAPLLAGLHAGKPERLSVQATFPELQRWERDHGSLIRGAKAALKGGARASERTAESERAAQQAARTPMFTTVWGGLSRLTDGLAEAIGRDRIRASSPASEVTRDGDRYTVLAAGGRVEADAVVLATPAFEAAALVRPLVPEAADELGAIPYASSAVVTLVYPQGTAERLPRGTGFVVAGDPSDLAITACTWLSRKWPDDSFADRAVVRCFVGRAGDEAALALPDEELAERVIADVERTSPVGARPEARSVIRWNRSMPQYEVGHRARVDRIRAGLRRAPGLFARGSAFDGVGIADCIRQATETAAEVRAYLHETAQRGEPPHQRTHEEVIR
jgi:oxygen-dependent protoporphyrinogen oxidase